MVIKSSNLWQKEQMSLITSISENVSKIKLGVEELLKARETAKGISDSQNRQKAIVIK